MNRLIAESKKLPQQKSPAWLKKRLTGVTGTDFDTIANGSPQAKEVLVMKKIGKPYVPFTGNKMTEHGVKYESEAIEKFKVLYPHITVHEDVSMIEHVDHPDDLFFSPDGVTACGSLIEVKCPYSRPINGSIPRNYISQIQFGMNVMNSYGPDIGHSCFFIQYKPRNFGTPFDKEILSVKKIKRDPDFLTKHMNNVKEFKSMVIIYRKFHDKFDEKTFFYDEEKE
jgi:hypothetical protein